MLLKLANFNVLVLKYVISFKLIISLYYIYFFKNTVKNCFLCIRNRLYEKINGTTMVIQLILKNQNNYKIYMLIFNSKVLVSNKSRARLKGGMKWVVAPLGPS